MSRIGHWMALASGRAFYPLDPRADEITIEDITHALARICRFGGHVRGDPYSVAQHSVLVSEAVLHAGGSQEEALWALLHDAAEAYCGDIIWPIKQAPALKAAFAPIEARLMAAICDRFALPHEEPAIVKHCDLRALATEKRDVMAASAAGSANLALQAAAATARTEGWHCDVVEPLRERIVPWGVVRAEVLFGERFDMLGGRR